jgi:SAM-dependent methyltransferase
LADLENLEEYVDAETYDLEHPRWGPEGPFYLEFARQASGPVLELGCGTGRLTIPFAQEGIDMVGLDVVPQMIARAREKTGDLPIKWIESDVRTFDLGTQFQLIFTTGFVFHHLLNRPDQESMLQRVREHLAPNGQFVIDIWFRPPTSMGDVHEEKRSSQIGADGQNVSVSEVERYDSLLQHFEQTICRRWHDSEEGTITRSTKLTYRYVFPQEMEALLHYNGLQVISRYGDWDRGPQTGKRGCHIYVCTKQ